ncbi:MAG: hypothetical protein K2X64_06430 [Rhodocyclaceae bacterium]|nr:hypothetical protein [Rhodocyclaceae bacterium]
MKFDTLEIVTGPSVYFEVLGEHGFIGRIPFLLLLAMTWFKCSSIKRVAGSDPHNAWARDLAVMIQVSMVAYMSGGAFLGLAYFDYIYHLVAVAVVTHHLVAGPASVPRSLARPVLGSAGGR